MTKSVMKDVLTAMEVGGIMMFKDPVLYRAFLNMYKRAGFIK